MRTIAVDLDGVLADALALFLEPDTEKSESRKGAQLARVGIGVALAEKHRDQRSLWKIDSFPSYLCEHCAFARFILVLLFRRDAANIS